MVERLVKRGQAGYNLAASDDNGGGSHRSRYRVVTVVFGVPVGKACALR